MTRGLVVLEADESIDELIDSAMAFAAGSGGDLVLLHVSQEENSTNERESMQVLTGNDSSYRPGIEGSKQFASDVGEHYIGNDVPFAVTAALGEKAGRVAATIEEFDCDHLFILGRKRSPTGKALFGDWTQSILLESDVPVTVIMRE